MSVMSDATVPAAPGTLDLELVANGVKLEWSASTAMEPVTYTLYRAGALAITERPA